MLEQFERTGRLLGDAGMDRLAGARVAVFGVGGVGGFAVEALVRSGIGALDLIDNDIVAVSNINRQIIATMKTVGRPKVEVAKERCHEINPECRIRADRTFYLPETADQFDFREYDYVVDCIDTVTGKIGIVMQAKEAKVPVISCMGAGNKLDPTRFEVADLSKTSVCPLAKVMRRELKKRGVEHLKVVYSREEAMKPLGAEDENPQAGKRQTPGSTAFVPSVAGLIIAGEVIKDICRNY